jgi:putative transposase
VGHEVNVKRIYPLYLEAGLAVWRRKRKRLVRDPLASARLLRANQEWARDFVVNGLANGRMVRILSVVDAYTRECPAGNRHKPGQRTRDAGAREHICAYAKH